MVSGYRSCGGARIRRSPSPWAKSAKPKTFSKTATGAKESSAMPAAGGGCRMMPARSTRANNVRTHARGGFPPRQHFHPRRSERHQPTTIIAKVKIAAQPLSQIGKTEDIQQHGHGRERNQGNACRVRRMQDDARQIDHSEQSQQPGQRRLTAAPALPAPPQRTPPADDHHSHSEDGRHTRALHFGHHETQIAAVIRIGKKCGVEQRHTSVQGNIAVSGIGEPIKNWKSSDSQHQSQQRAKDA